MQKRTEKPLTTSPTPKFPPSSTIAPSFQPPSNPMPQDLPPSGGYEPIQYKVQSPNLHCQSIGLIIPTAQSPRARFPPFLLPLRHGPHLHLRPLQNGQGDQRAEVRLPISVSPRSFPAAKSPVFDDNAHAETGIRDVHLAPPLIAVNSRIATGALGF